MDFSVFDRLGSAKILVVGDVMLDRYWRGDSSRISPEAPVPVVKVQGMEDRVGGAGNVARNIAHLGASVSLLGIIGDNHHGDELESLLAKEHIESKLLRQSAQPTITKLRVISRNQQVVRLDFEQTFSEQAAKNLKQFFFKEFENYDCIIFSDYNKGSLAYVAEMITEAKKAKKLILVDPKAKDLSAYSGASFITPNLKEFVEAGGDDSSEQSIQDSAHKIQAQCNIDNILLTRSEAGMSLISKSKKFDLPAQVLEVNDVTGAGDTVIAVFATFLAVNMPAEDAAVLANLAAGIVVGRLGAACVSPVELMQKLNRSLSESKSKGNSVEEDLLQIEFAKQNGEKIVFTNGCFDILHAGHVQYLQEARNLGHRLVVGLNTDDSVRRLKGDTRPVNSYAQRAAVLRALSAVDWVIPFGEANDDTPLALIKRVNPNVLVKGGDYSIDTVVGADFVLGQGGDVQLLSFLDGVSTSKIIEKVQK